MVFYATILHCKAILGIIWANEMNFVMNHTPGAGSIWRLKHSATCVTELRMRLIIQREDGDCRAWLYTEANDIPDSNDCPCPASSQCTLDGSSDHRAVRTAGRRNDGSPDRLHIPLQLASRQASPKTPPVVPASFCAAPSSGFCSWKRRNSGWFKHILFISKGLGVA